MTLEFLHWRSLKTRVTLITLAIFVVSIWALALYITQMLRADLEHESGQQQLSAISFVAAEINTELEELIAILETGARTIDASTLNDPAALQRLLEQRQVIQEHFNAGILVLARDGTAVADVPAAAGRLGTNYFDNEADHIALTQGKSAISGPMIGRKLRQPLFNIAAPIRDGEGKVIGAFVGVINLALPNFLDSIGKHRYGASGGYLVVDPKHRLFVSASDKTRVMQPVPAPGTNRLFDRRMQGFDAPDVAINSLGVENLSSAARIPVAGWFAIAALPTQEAFAPIRDMVKRIVASTILLTLMAGGVTWWMLRRQLAPMLATLRVLATLADTNQPLQPLPIARQDEVGDLIGGFNRLLETVRKREQALRARDERFQALFDRASDGIAILSPRGRLIAVNASFARMHGYTTEEMLRMNLEDLDTPESHRLVPDRMRRILAGESLTFEVEHYHKDGHTVPLEVSSSLIPAEDEPVIQAFHRDITGRKLAEKALERESQRSRVFLRNASDGVHILNSRGDVLEVSDSFCRMLGYAREELIGANVSLWDARWTPRELTVQLAQQIANKGQSVFRTTHRRRDGSVFDVEVTGQALELDGEPAIFNSARDITERKRAEASIRESEIKYRLLFETANDGIFLSNAEGFVDCNQKGAEMYGLSKKDLIGRSPAALSPPRQPDGRLSSEAAAEYYESALMGETPIFEWQALRADGSRIDVEITLNRIQISGATCFQAIVRDITDRKRLEDVHLRAQKLESLGTLAGGIAHDFNNILAAIRGNAELAAQDVGPDHIAAQSLDEIRKASARASELVRRIMAFGRPTESRQVAVDLSTVVDEVLKLLRSTLPAGIALERAYANDAPPVLADAGQVHEAIVNLTTNAAYAIGPRAGTIEYRLTPVLVDEALARKIPGLKEGRYARLTVSDSGCGMDAATLARIFDVFYTTKPVGEGTGLGLSMVHGTMRSHGGAVTVDSTPGKGSSFALYFPAAKEMAQKEEAGVAPAQALVSGRRVLYVDDEEALVLLASRVLSRLGHEVASFTDPVAALQEFYARPRDFDVVVTDLSMPYMSGVEFAREVIALCPDMPVVMTTGYLRSEDEKLARTAGVRELILKPTTMDELARVLDTILRGQLA